MAMGSLALAMIGIICLARCWPTCSGVVVPLYQALGADPAMFAGTSWPTTWGARPWPRSWP